MSIELETLRGLKDKANFFEVYHVTTFRCFRNAKKGGVQDVTVEVWDAGPDHSSGRYTVVAKSADGHSASGNSAPSIDVALAFDSISANRDGISAGKDGISAGKDGISSVKDDVSAVKDDVSAGKDDVSAGKDDVSAGKDDVSDVKDSLSSAECRISTARVGFGVRSVMAVSALVPNV